MSYARSPRLVCSTTIGTRFRPFVSWLMRLSVLVGRTRITLTGRITSWKDSACSVCVGALGDPVDHLLFHHAVLQARHEMGVVAVQLNDLLRLLVGRGDQAHRLVQTALVRALSSLRRAISPTSRPTSTRLRAASMNGSGVDVDAAGPGGGPARPCWRPCARASFSTRRGGISTCAYVATSCSPTSLAQALHQRALELALEVGADFVAELLRARRCARRSCG